MRTITLVLQRGDGSVVGALDPFTVELPWWSEAASVVEAARTERGVDVTVLRLLHGAYDNDDPEDLTGSVTYAAELHGEIPADLRAVDPRDATAALDDHPLRLPWARPGGPAREVAWAEQVLAERGREAIGPARQMRAWNLSSIWSIPTTKGTAWLKSVPPFFAHEGRTIEWLADPALPPLIGADDGRVLMAEIPGTDQYGAPLGTLTRAVETLVAIQHRVADRIDELLALGLPDWRWPAFRPLMDDVVDRHRHELDDSERRALEELAGDFDARCAAIDSCGLPATLVHGDFHPGNLRGDDDHLAILDWGDCGVGHPLFDVAAMVEMLGAEPRAELVGTWVRVWREHRPGSDPLLATRLMEPIAAVRQAVIYRGFLDQIEPSERCFHSSDPARWLRRAAAVSAVS